MSERETQTEPMVQTLFGDWVYAKPRKKGRPPFERTEENANKVSMLLAMGWSNERIAGCILDPRTGKSICVKTLQRHFSRELLVRDHERDRLIAHQLMSAKQAADAGNVGAMRLFDQLVTKNDLVLAAARMADAGTAATTQKLGKKEARQRDAKRLISEDVQSSWGDDLKPGLH